MTLVFATTNPGKLAELRGLLGEGHTVLEAGDVPSVLEVEEDRDTFHGNAAKKALAYCEASGLSALADDSGLCVDALGGRPGVHSARYAPSDRERLAKLLAELEGVSNRAAHFVCVLALAVPGQSVTFAEGRCVGTIADAPRGNEGFGYDPVFLLPSGLALAQLTREQKAQVSHRGQAFRAMRPQLLALR